MQRITKLVGLGAGIFGAVILAVTGANASSIGHGTVASTTPATFTPNLVDDGAFRPYALTINQAGGDIIVGGRFNQVENSKRTIQYSRNNVFAFNATTGVVSPFAPTFNGQVWTVLGNGDAVYIGGEFTTVNGPLAHLAKLSLSTGQLDPAFTPMLPGGRVTDLQLSNGRLFVSGAFKKKLVALDPNTGKVSTYLNIPVTDALQFTTRPEVFRFDISPDGQHLAAVGNFRTVGGFRHYRAFMLDLGPTTATVSPWYYQPLERDCHAAAVSPVYQYYVKDVDFSPDSQFFNMASTGGHRINGEGPGQVLCDSVSRFSIANLTPQVPYWVNYTGGDTLHSVIDTGAAVYVQGHSRWLDNPYGADYAGPGAVVRPGGGAIDPATGKALDWVPPMPQQKGGYQMYANAQGVWFATDGKFFGGKYKLGLRMAPVSP